MMWKWGYIVRTPWDSEMMGVLLSFWQLGINIDISRNRVSKLRMCLHQIGLLACWGIVSRLTTWCGGAGHVVGTNPGQFVLGTIRKQAEWAIGEQARKQYSSIVSAYAPAWVPGLNDGLVTCMCKQVNEALSSTGCSWPWCLSHNRKQTRTVE